MKVLLFVMIGVMATAIAQAETKIGVINMDKLLQNNPQVKKIRADIEADFQKKKKELEKSEKELKTLETELEKKKAVLSEEALRQKQEDFQKQMWQFREAVTKSQSEIQKKQNELLGPVLEQVRKAIAKVAAERGYSLVVSQDSNLLFVGPGVDFTEEVMMVK